MSELSDKTKIPLAWAAGIIVSLCSVVATAAVDQYRVGDLEKRFSNSERDKEKHDDEDMKRDIAMVQVVDRLKSIDDTLKEMKDDAKDRRH